MFNQNIVSKSFRNYDQFIIKNKDKFINELPFSSIVIKDFFNESFLNKILEDFPNLEEENSSQKYKNKNEVKFTNNNYKDFPNSIKLLIDFLNSNVFLFFLQRLTCIKEKLYGDEELNGGGLHEIKKGGVLKIHTDFNKHPNSNLDRRLNLLLYLNKNWENEYGGHLELWDKDMKKCMKKVSPDFNTMVIFATTDFSYHGHPDPLNCPISLSRKSIATYYFSESRPINEIDKSKIKNRTYFISRGGFKNDTENKNEFIKDFFRKFKIYNKIKEFEKKYIRRKKN